MTFAKVFLFTAAAAISGPALASVMVVGNSSARTCYEAAESQNRPSLDQLRQCDRALSEEALAPHDAVATRVNRGILRIRVGRTEDAIRDFDVAMALDPSEPEAYLNKGAALVRAGQPQAALPLFGMALDHKTRKPAFAHFGRGVAYEELGDVKAAYREYRMASSADPNWNRPREELLRFTVSRR
jgi:tetratricopeptide (TPR) repeat protein